MNKGGRNVRCFSQFKNSYGKVRAELGFFKPLVLTPLCIPVHVACYTISHMFVEFFMSIIYLHVYLNLCTRVRIKFLNLSDQKFSLELVLNLFLIFGQKSAQVFFLSLFLQKAV